MLLAPTSSLRFSSSPYDLEWAHFTSYRFMHLQLVLKALSSVCLPDLTAHTKYGYKADHWSFKEKKKALII